METHPNGESPIFFRGDPNLRSSFGWLHGCPLWPKMLIVIHNTPPTTTIVAPVSMAEKSCIHPLTGRPGNGVLEYWSTGVLGPKYSTPLLQS